MNVRRLVLALALGAGAVALPFAPARSDGGLTVTKVGWWTRNPAAQAPPEGGIAVQQGPDGPVSIAAISVSTSGRVTKAELKLTEAGGVAQDGAELKVCTTPNQWKSGGAQAMSDAPKPECDTGPQAILKRDAASASWTADVTTLFSAGSSSSSSSASYEPVSLMVVPGGSGSVPVGFEVRFNPPQVTGTVAAASDSTVGGSAEPSAAYTPTGGDVPASSADSGSSAPFTAPSASTSFSTSASAPFDAGAPAAAPAPAATETAPAPAPPAATEPAVLPSARTAGVTAPTGSHTVQALFFVVLATVAGTGAGGARWFLRRRSDDFSFSG